MSVSEAWALIDSPMYVQGQGEGEAQREAVSDSNLGPEISGVCFAGVGVVTKGKA